jgi:hypothetical protein
MSHSSLLTNIEATYAASKSARPALQCPSIIMARIYVQFAQKSYFYVSKRNERMFQLYEIDGFAPYFMILSIFSLTPIDLLMVAIVGIAAYQIIVRRLQS